MIEEVFFEKINGSRVFCCLTEPPDTAATSKRLVIMSHGFRGSSLGPARSFVDLARLLAREGFSALRFDQPNCGNSEGDYIGSSFREWVETIAYLGKKYLEQGYKLALLGQSMGATATMIATAHPYLRDKVECVILWVPDPETDFSGDPDAIYEEGGEKYKGRFWEEAKAMDFFGCMDRYSGGIHLVYGEHDRYVSEDLRKQTISRVQQKGEDVTILKGQDHSPWEYDLTQDVYRLHIAKLKQYL